MAEGAAQQLIDSAAVPGEPRGLSLDPYAIELPSRTGRRPGHSACYGLPIGTDPIELINALVTSPFRSGPATPISSCPVCMFGLC